MLSQEVIDGVRQLLEAGSSRRTVARVAGISRGTVNAIAQGKREDRQRRPIDVDDEPLGPIVRCAECGGRVHAPCRLCRIRRIQADERANRRRMAGRNLALTDKLLARRKFDPTFG